MAEEFQESASNGGITSDTVPSETTPAEDASIAIGIRLGYCDPDKEKAERAYLLAHGLHTYFVPVNALVTAQKVLDAVFSLWPGTLHARDLQRSDVIGYALQYTSKKGVRNLAPKYFSLTDQAMRIMCSTVTNFAMLHLKDATCDCGSCGGSIHYPTLTVIFKALDKTGIPGLMHSTTLEDFDNHETPSAFLNNMHVILSAPQAYVLRQRVMKRKRSQELEEELHKEKEESATWKAKYEDLKERDKTGFQMRMGRAEDWALAETDDGSATIVQAKSPENPYC